MSSEDEAWKRRREREQERENEEAEEALKKGQAPSSKQLDSSSHLDALIQKANVMIDQLNNLYTMFATGAERIPPLERRKILDQMILSIQGLSKPTPAAIFKTNAVEARYISHRDRWDKLMKDIESGKIKRIAGPKK